MKRSIALAVLAPLVIAAAPSLAKTSDSLSEPVAGRADVRVALNPQPLPPRWKLNRYRLRELRMRNPSDRMLNPQPLPPGPDDIRRPGLSVVR